MNIKDILTKGYPFVESILSALPLCDEFVISDGYSEDGTYEILEKLAEIHPKIKLIRVKWNLDNKNRQNGKFLAETGNATMRFCKGRYIFYHQASEIIHEKSVNKIRQLILDHPKIIFFHLPYYNFVKNILFSEEFRLRLSKKMPEVFLVEDAANFKFTRKATMKMILNAIFSNPFKSKDALAQIFSSYGFVYGPYMHAILPQPIYRYSGLYRNDLIKKMEQHAEKIKYKNFENIHSDIAKILKEKSNSQNFGQIWIDNLYKNWNPPPTCLEPPRTISLNEHPKIMQELLEGNKKEYIIRKKLLSENFLNHL